MTYFEFARDPECPLRGSGRVGAVSGVPARADGAGRPTRQRIEQVQVLCHAWITFTRAGARDTGPACDALST